MDALRQAVFGLLDYAWGRIRGRMDGLDDDEYLWRPVTPSWSVVRVGDRYEVEREVPPPEPAPITTIAWLTWHLGAECLDGYTELIHHGAQVATLRDLYRLRDGWIVSPTEARARG